MKTQIMVTALAALALAAAPGMVVAQAEHEEHHAETGSAAAPTDGTGTIAPEQTAPAQGSDAQSGETGTSGTGMMGSQMMGPDMMRMMHRMMQGMSQGESAGAPGVVFVVPMPMMEGGMMRSAAGGMQGRGMGMMSSGAMGGAGPSATGGAAMGLAGDVVLPARHLSVEDVTHHLEHRLERAGNPLLQLGDVAETGEEMITAEIVTTDGSLVERLRVDRHSGAIEAMR